VKRWKRQPALRLVRARSDAEEAEPVSNRRVRRRSIEVALRGVIPGDILTNPDRGSSRSRPFAPDTKAKLAHPSCSDHGGDASCFVPSRRPRSRCHICYLVGYSFAQRPGQDPLSLGREPAHRLRFTEIKLFIIPPAKDR
jgi:hypothetical protein